MVILNMEEDALRHHNGKSRDAWRHDGSLSWDCLEVSGPKDLGLT